MREEVLKNLAVILPSLDPDYKFEGVVNGLVEAGFEHIVMVDDGSDENHKEPFKKALQNSACTLLVHEVNKGKGRALKDAFAYVHENLPEVKGVITIDGDGQHLLKDIIHCGEVMLEKQNQVILGSRSFDQEGVPPRSVAGNKFSARMFKLLFGIKITDTQTGLRAIPSQYLDLFSKIEGERFEYETNMLLVMKREKISFYEQEITTVYDPEDYSSHYNAVKDSARVAKIMLKFLVSGSAFKYVLSSLLGVAVDNVLFYVLCWNFGVSHQVVIQPISTFISSIVNFSVNKVWVFEEKDTKTLGAELLKYYAIFFPRTAISILSTYLAIDGFNVETAGLGTLLKMVIDIILFIVVYFLQKKFVFIRKKEK